MSTDYSMIDPDLCRYLQMDVTPFKYGIPLCMGVEGECRATETGGMPPVIRSTKNMPHQRRTATLDLINDSFLLTGRLMEAHGL